MKQETRTAVYDDGLHLEACRFTGIAQPFPHHFHEYYVIGLMESGQRTLFCKGADYVITSGDMLLFNPEDSHACVQRDGGTLDYRGLNISRDIMLELAEELTGKRELPRFSPLVIHDDRAAASLRSLHELIMDGSQELEKEESLLLLLSILLRRYTRPFTADAALCREEIAQVCRFMEAHYAQRIRLDQLCRCAGCSKSALLRAFTLEKGVTPYRYLESIRIREARKLLEQGVSPAEAALLTGFSDQSHFTNYFKRFIGLAPGVYREMFEAHTENGGTYGAAK